MPHRRKTHCCEVRATDSSREGRWRGGRGQIIEGLNKEFGFYSEYDGKLLENWEQGCECICLCFAKITVVAAWRIDYEKVRSEAGKPVRKLLQASK